jgi:hypothetical protein
MTDKTQTIKVRDDIVLREEADGAFLFDPENGRLCYLNDVGIDIWKMCRKAPARDQVVTALAAEYPEVSQAQIKSDCASFFEELDRLGFLSA